MQPTALEAIKTHSNRRLVFQIRNNVGGFSWQMEVRNCSVTLYHVISSYLFQNLTM